MAAQNNTCARSKKDNNRVTNKIFLFIQVSNQRIRNLPTFASAKTFDHKKNNLNVYDSLSAEL